MKNKLLPGVFALTIGATSPAFAATENGVKTDTKIEVSTVLIKKIQKNTKNL